MDPLNLTLATYTAYDALEVEPTLTVTTAEPTAGELVTIASEEPVIAAEVAVVDAECALAASPDEVAVRRHRRAVAALNVVLRTAVQISTRRADSTAPAYEPGAVTTTGLRRVVIRPAVRTSTRIA